jgi:hypothetical protein
VLRSILGVCWIRRLRDRRSCRWYFVRFRAPLQWIAIQIRFWQSPRLTTVGASHCRYRFDVRFNSAPLGMYVGNSISVSCPFKNASFHESILCDILPLYNRNYGISDRSWTRYWYVIWSTVLMQESSFASSIMTMISRSGVGDGPKVTTQLQSGHQHFDQFFYLGGLIGFWFVYSITFSRNLYRLFHVSLHP